MIYDICSKRNIPSSSCDPWALWLSTPEWSHRTVWAGPPADASTTWHLCQLFRLWNLPPWFRPTGKGKIWFTKQMEVRSITYICQRIDLNVRNDNRRIASHMKAKVLELLLIQIVSPIVLLLIVVQRTLVIGGGYVVVRRRSLLQAHTSWGCPVASRRKYCYGSKALEGILNLVRCEIGSRQG